VLNDATTFWTGCRLEAGSTPWCIPAHWPQSVRPASQLPTAAPSP
jgi:hypothetical protein